MQQETYFTYKLYTATGPGIDVDKILGRRLLELEQPIIWTPEQRAEIFDRIGNADLESAFKILMEIIPSSLSLPFAELGALRDEMNRVLLSESSKGAASSRINDEYDRITKEVSEYVLRWLDYRRLPDEKDYNSYPNEVKPFIEDQLRLGSFENVLEILKRYLHGVDDPLFADTLVIKARFQRLSYENFKGGADISENALDGIRTSIQSIIRELPGPGAYVGDLLQSSEEDSSLKSLLLEFLGQGRRTSYSIEDLQRFGGKEEGFKDFQYSTIDEIQSGLESLMSEGLISSSQSVEGEIKYQFGPTISTDGDDEPAAWIFIKGLTEPEKSPTGVSPHTIAYNFGMRLASTRMALIIGSWRGVNAEVGKGFIQQKFEQGSEYDGSFRMLASSDIGLMLESLGGVSSWIDVDSVKTDVRAESFADAVVIIGQSGSTNDVAKSFLKREKPVYPIAESGAADILKKYILTMESVDLENIYGNEFRPEILSNNYKDAIDYIIRNLEERYDPPQQAE